MRRSLGLAIVGVLALTAAACGSDNTPTTPTTPAPAPGTDTFTGTLAPGGTVMHSFTASAAGPVVVTLTGAGPGSPLVGLGIGVPGANIGGCDLTKTVQTVAGPIGQLTASVEAGDYCAGAFDVGTAPSTGVLVTMSVSHP
jgi:hypothetical protein